MDGTLLDSERLWDVALHELARDLGGELSPTARRAMIGSSTAMAIELMFTDLGLPLEQPAMDDAATWMLTRTGELFAEALTWRPGAEETLHLVQQAGVPMALVTNTARMLADKALATMGPERFTVTVCGDEVAHGKPAPDPYLRAAELLGLEPGECLVVEDSPTGTAAAEAAGCPVLVVPCEIEVSEGPGRVLRESLEGVTWADLCAAWSAGVSPVEASWENRRS